MDDSLCVIGLVDAMKRAKATSAVMMHVCTNRYKSLCRPLSDKVKQKTEFIASW